MHDQIDKDRDQTPKRKRMHDQIDKDRDQTSKRKNMHKKIDQGENKKLKLQKFEQTDTRRKYMNTYNKSRIQRQLCSRLATDTGFDIICSSCLQYKSKHLCKSIESLEEEKSKKFVIKFCSLLKNRSEGQFICFLCLKDINRDKIPKRSHIDKFKFGIFPQSFVQRLKQKC